MQGARRKWLCVAYAFPPINRSGTHRTAAFVRHLDRLGWDADVITVKPDGGTLDAQLSATIPPSTTVHRTGWTDFIALAKSVFRKAGPTNSLRRCTSAPRESKTERQDGWSEWFSRLLQTPDSRVGWIPHAVAAGARCIRRTRPEVLYSTSPYASAHLAALILHRMFRIPWVADFRDPWMGNPYVEATFPSLRRWNAFWERTVVGSASAVICNTATLRESMLDRHPRAADRCHVMANGIDSDLFRGLEGIRTAPSGTFVLLHAGQFYGPRKPTLLFEALRRALGGPLAGRSATLALLGSEQYDGRSLKELANAAGVGPQVKVLGTLPHQQSLAHLIAADALVLMGASGRGADLQVPNKLFEYLGARRPILAAVPTDSPSVDILNQARADAVVCDPGDVESMTTAITCLALGTYDRPADPWSGLGRFERRRRADELSNIFESLTGSRRVLKSRSVDLVAAHAKLNTAKEALSCE